MDANQRADKYIKLLEQYDIQNAMMKRLYENFKRSGRKKFSESESKAGYKMACEMARLAKEGYPYVGDLKKLTRWL